MGRIETSWVLRVCLFSPYITGIGCYVTEIKKHFMLVISDGGR